MIGRRRVIRVWIFAKQYLILLSRVARGVVVFCLLRAFSRLSIRCQSGECRSCQGYRAHAQEASPGRVFHHGSLSRMVAHHRYLSCSGGRQSITSAIERLKPVLTFSTASLVPSLEIEESKRHLRTKD